MIPTYLKFKIYLPRVQCCGLRIPSIADHVNTSSELDDQVTAIFFPQVFDLRLVQFYRAHEVLHLN